MLNAVDQTFHDLYSNILENGHFKGDRTAVGTLMLPAQMMRFDTSNGQIPILSTRYVPTKAFRREMLDLFVAGTSSIKELRANKVGIWDSWFIKGTDRYEEAVLHTVTEMMDLAKEKVGWAEVTKLVDPLAGNGEQSINRPYRAMKIREALAKEFGIPLYKSTPTPISIQRRLARVSKNNLVAWGAIAATIDGLGTPDVEHTVIKLVVFSPTEKVFGELDFPERWLPQLEAVLDLLKIPKYELVDADIGKGSYGIQWRKWKDTQVVRADENLIDWTDRGYKVLGVVNSPDLPRGTVVVEREIDQLQNMIDQLRYEPDDRRIIVSAWNPGRIWQAALPPCHLYFQCVSWELSTRAEFEEQINKANLGKDYLVALMETDYDPDSDEESVEFARKFCVEHQLPIRTMTMFVVLRSSDTPLGAVFNAAQYAYLQHMIAHVTNHATSELVTVGVDSHIYTNQIEKVKELLTRETPEGSNPRVVFNRKVTDIDDFKLEDIDIVDYFPGPKLDIPVAV
jgi:thymidylate synthase